MSQVEISNDSFFSERMIRRESQFSFENYRLGKAKMNGRYKKFYKELNKQIKFDEKLKKGLEKLRKRDEETQINQEKIDNFKKSNARVVLVKI